MIFSAWVACLLWGGIPASAHFGMVIPSDSMVMQAENRTIRLTLAFCDPFEGQGLDLARPKGFGVHAQGSREELTVALAPIQWMGRSAWQTDYALKRPGAYLFYKDPSFCRAHDFNSGRFVFYRVNPPGRVTPGGEGDLPAPIRLFTRNCRWVDKGGRLQKP